jgi:DNA polymerase I
VHTQIDQPQYASNADIRLTRESLALEESLIPITAEMNSRPLKINYATWKRNLDAAQETSDFLNTYCQHLARDDNFRPNSAKDCAAVLFKDVPPKSISKKSGRPSTDRDTLSELSNEGNILAGAVIDARSAISRLSQLRAWEPFALAGSVWTLWDSLGCPHGRYTSENPSLTNRIEPIRQTIVPDPGYSFLSLDLNQAEYITWASLSGDQVLATLFLQGKDFHTAMAQDIRKLVPSWDLRGQDERSAGKTINFSILYQMQPHTLARKLGCSVETAQKIITAYYKRASCAKRYIDDVLTRAEQLGFVETYFGRRRYCPEYSGKIKDREAHEFEKTLWSHVNSGTAAELLKFKQVALWNALRHIGFEPDQVRLVINLFDETIWHVRDDLLDEVTDLAASVWNEPIQGFLPFDSTIQTGKNWEAVSK